MSVGVEEREVEVGGKEGELERGRDREERDVGRGQGGRYLKALSRSQVG